MFAKVMSHQTNSIMAITNFRNSLTKKTRHGNDGCVFTGVVTYYAKGKRQIEVLDVYIFWGYENKVELDLNFNAKLITTDNYHTRFFPIDGTVFSLDEKSNTLIIEGNTDKMGQYKVEINEV